MNHGLDDLSADTAYFHHSVDDPWWEGIDDFVKDSPGFGEEAAEPTLAQVIPIRPIRSDLAA